jgi:hypothetical protein
MQERGKDYAAALFLMLLPKATDNPTGYISSAYKHGAEPTSNAMLKVKDFWNALDILTKAPDLQEIKQRIQEAVTKDDSETLFTLTQTQSKIKSVLQLFSWAEDLAALFQQRDAFIELLGL